MEDELTAIKREVKKDILVQEGDVDRAIELTYHKITLKWIKRLKLWSD